MRVELVQTKTADGVRLDGAWQPATRSASDITTVESVICLHGVGGNFYGSTMMEQISLALIEQGLSVLRVNTRGHDGVSTASTDQGGRLQGAAYEIVDECRYDVQAWVRFVQDHDCERIALLGHSLGAIKVLYAQAVMPQSAVTHVIAISPPRLAYSRFMLGHDMAAFKESIAAADELIAAGQSQALFQATFPFPLVLSAATFRDKYGPEERYNFLKLAGELSTAADFIYGQQEIDVGNSAFAGIVDDVQSADWASGYSLSVIPEANHFYTGRWPQLIEVVKQKLL